MHYHYLHKTYFYLIMITCSYNVDPFIDSKIGVYRGIHYFLIFALKHRLLILVRPCVPTIYVLSKNKKNTCIKIFQLKIFIFATEKYCSVLLRHVNIMYLHVAHLSLVARKPVFGVSDQV